MTILVAFVCEDYAVFLSDRRLTRSDGTTTEIVENHRTKSVLWNGSIVFGYTGLANIAGQAADEWLVFTLAVADPIGVLIDEASRVFQKPWATRLRPSSIRRTAFVGIGWTVRGPAIFKVSNYHNELDQMTAEPLPAFASHLYSPPFGHGSLLRQFGAGETDPRWKDLGKKLAAHVAVGATPTQVVNSMVRTVRAITSDYAEIGHNVLTTMLPNPKHRDLNQTFAMTTGQSLEMASVHLWSNGAQGPDTVTPGLTGPSPVIRIMGGHGSPFDSVILFNDALETLDVRWPLWIAMFDYGGSVFVGSAIDGRSDGAVMVHVASSWDGFPKLYAEADDYSPVVPGMVESLDSLRGLLRDNPQFEQVMFHRDDKAAEVTAPRSLLLDTTCEAVRTIDDGTLAHLARHLLRMKW